MRRHEALTARPTPKSIDHPISAEAFTAPRVLQHEMPSKILSNNMHLKRPTQVRIGLNNLI